MQAASSLTEFAPGTHFKNVIDDSTCKAEKVEKVKNLHIGFKKIISHHLVAFHFAQKSFKFSIQIKIKMVDFPDNLRFWQTLDSRGEGAR